MDFVADGCSATAGADYVPQSGTLKFPAGETEQSILIPILDDALAEGDETVNLTLTDPLGLALGRHRTAVLVIHDNEEETPNARNLTPRRKGLWSTASGSPVDVEAAGHFAYLRMVEGDLQVLDITDPSSPQRVGSYAGRVGGDFDLAVSGNYVYMADGPAGLQVIDVSNPASPRWVGGYDTGVDALGVAVSGNFAYVADWMDGFQVIDISNPANPQRVGLYLTDRYFGSVSLSGNFAYLGLDLWDGQQHHGSQEPNSRSPQ